MKITQIQGNTADIYLLFLSRMLFGVGFSATGMSMCGKQFIQNAEEERVAFFDFPPFLF